MMKLNKFFIIIIYFSFLYSTEEDYTAIGVMEKVMTAPKPESSISEIHLEIVRNKFGKIKRKTRAFLRYE